MLRTLWLAAVLAAAIVLEPGAAVAARLALVIGVNDYVNVPRLEKAVGDAQAMAAKLETLGFTVSQVLNPDRRSLNQAISAFQRQIKPGDDVLVHFSGHGVEVDGNNLLLPVDVPLPEPGDKDFLIGEAISLGDLMQRVADTHAGTQVFVIDACRDNPFATKGGRGIGSTRGLAAVIPPTGAFVLYSAGRGQAALDKLNAADTAPTSVYTRVLIETIGEPGMSLAGIARSVRTKVAALAESVKHDQDPAYYDELTGDFFFAEDEASGTATPKTTTPATTPATPPSGDTARQDYEAAQALNTAEAWTTFLKYHSTGYYADLGKVALDKLTRAEPPAVKERDQASLVEQDLGNLVLDPGAADGNYYVFIGAFSSRDGAETTRRGLGGLADTARTLRSNDYVGLTRDLWAVAIGPMYRSEAAGALAEARYAFPDAYVRQTRNVDDPAATNDVYYLVGLVPTGDNWLALRTSPDRTGERLAKMGPTTLLRVTSRSGDWYQVEVLNTSLRGARGWAFAKYVKCCL